MPKILAKNKKIKSERYLKQSKKLVKNLTQAKIEKAVEEIKPPESTIFITTPGKNDENRPKIDILSCR